MSETPGRRRLRGCAALITGASRGIGRAIALRYAEEGAELCITATDQAKLEETRALAAAQGAVQVADVSDRAAVAGLAAAALGALGRIDVLVNNAGIYKAARLVDTAPEDFDRVMLLV